VVVSAPLYTTGHQYAAHDAPHGDASFVGGTFVPYDDAPGSGVASLAPQPAPVQSAGEPQPLTLEEAESAALPPLPPFSEVLNVRLGVYESLLEQMTVLVLQLSPPDRVRASHLRHRLHLLKKRVREERGKVHTTVDGPSFFFVFFLLLLCALFARLSFFSFSPLLSLGVL
jgi:hypothetical protein